MSISLIECTSDFPHNYVFMATCRHIRLTATSASSSIATIAAAPDLVIIVYIYLVRLQVVQRVESPTRMEAIAIGAATEE